MSSRLTVFTDGSGITEGWPHHFVAEVNIGDAASLSAARECIRLARSGNSDGPESRHTDTVDSERRRLAAGVVVLASMTVGGCTTTAGADPRVEPAAVSAVRDQRAAEPQPGKSTPVAAADVLHSLPRPLADRLRFERARGAQPGFTRQALLRSADWADSNVRGTPPASVLLRRVTDSNYGPEHARGVVDPIINRRLVWVVADADAVVCAASGGPMAQGQSSEKNPAPQCGEGAFLTLIDARTGEFLFGYQA